MNYECDRGWWGIVEETLSMIRSIDENAKIIFVRQKFGKLDFKVASENKDVFLAIEDAVKKSEGICERCGSNEDVFTRGSSYIRTICNKCDSELDVDF